MQTATKQQPAMPANTNGSVRVEIFDQVYHLRGSDSEYISRLAKFVDSKIRAVAEQTATVDTLRLAILAALNIADEYHVLQRRHDGAGSDYVQRAQRLSGALDEVLLEEKYRERSA